MTDAVGALPWPITAVEHRGGTVLRISHADGTVADHDMAHLIGGGVFATFTAKMIGESRLIDGTVGWVIDGEVVDLAPDGLWDHTRGNCGGGGCIGWTPDQTVVVALPTDAVADQIVRAWSRIAADTSAVDGAAWLHDDGGADWAAVLLTERFRAGIGAAVVQILERGLPLTAAGLCVREVIRACNEAYTPLAGRVATAAAAGGDPAAVAAAEAAESEPVLRQAISLAVERALRRAEPDQSSRSCSSADGAMNGSPTISSRRGGSAS